MCRSTLTSTANSILYSNLLKMNKLTIILSALALLTACQKDAGVQTPEEAVVTYEMQAPFEFEIKSGADAGNGSAINALWYGVYHRKDNGTYAYMSDMSAYVSVTDVDNISVPITLFKDQEYKIIFVAQHIESVASVDGSSNNCYTYIINELGQMSLNPSAVITDGEQLDAFVYCEETGVIQNDYKKEVELSRPLAQINISTTATEVPEKITVKVSDTAESYDIFAGEYSSQTKTQEFQKLTCSGSVLATVYLLPATGSVTLDLTMTYGDSSTKTMTVQSVSVAPNYKTNVTGNI